MYTLDFLSILKFDKIKSLFQVRFNREYSHRVTDISLANTGTLMMVTLNSKIMLYQMAGKSDSDEVVSLPSERVEGWVT